MMRILFVCHGNICRSTMAEFVLKDMVAKRGVADRFHIESAATSTEEIGNPVHPGTQAVLRAHGIGGFAGKRARQLRRGDYDDFDLIIGMDSANISNLRAIAPSPEAESKIHAMSEYFSPSARHDHVPDPYYGGAEGFEYVLDLLEDACAGLLERISQSN